MNSLKELKGNIKKSMILFFFIFKNKKNIFWNLFGGLWLAALILISTPFYLSKLGFDLFGVFSLWMVLQVMMNLFDFGLGSTIIKDFSASNGVTSYSYKADLLRSIEIFYWIIAVIIFSILLVFSAYISSDWIILSSETDVDLVLIMTLMSITLFFQFPNLLYLNGLSGLQEHVLMNVVQIIGNSLRYGSGIIILFWYADLIWFFGAQIFVAAMQTFFTRYVLWKKLTFSQRVTPIFRFELLKQSSKFSFGMAMTSICAVLLANVDRIGISMLLSASELGKYAIAFTATGLLQLGIQPFYRTYFPRYSELYSKGEIIKLRREYLVSTMMIASILVPLGSIGFFFAEGIFFVWLGINDVTIVNIFKLLLIGITCSGLCWLPAAFQQAQGWTSLHVKMLLGALLIGTPCMFWAINNFGVYGASIVWLIHGVSNVTLGLWLMHRRLLIGEFVWWYKSVILPPVLITIPMIYLSLFLMPSDLSKLGTLIWVGLTAIFVMFGVGMLGVRKLKSNF